MTDERPIACEVCGASAAVLIADAREVDPVEDGGGRLWRRWEQDGPTHPLCEAHRREPVHVFRPGTPEEEIARVRRAEQEARIWHEAMAAGGASDATASAG